MDETSNTGKANSRTGNWALVAPAIVSALVVVALLIILGREESNNSIFSFSKSIPLSRFNATSTGSSVSDSLSKPYPVVFETAEGTPDAPVTIVEYSDFQCRFCQEFALTTQKRLEETYIENGKVRLVFKNRIIFGEGSVRAAEAAEAAAEQDKFWPYCNLLMQTQASPKMDELSTSRLNSIAQQAGLDLPLFTTSLESEELSHKVMQDDNEGKALGVNGTPTFFVNGMKVEGDLSFEELQQVIEESIGSSQ